MPVSKWPEWFAAFLVALVLPSVVISGCSSDAAVQKKNGFDVSNALVPVEQILSGGPQKDGIPALTLPETLPAGQVTYLDDQDRVLGLVVEGKARAYPIRLLNWHEIVNDQIAGRRLLVTYCPLCGSGVAFKPQLGGVDLEFGVSGLLYNSDMLLYDRQTGSLWSQIGGQAISGVYKGKQLTREALIHTTWGDWRTHYPQTEVLSLNTGYQRDYSSDPYGNYRNSFSLYFDISDYPPKQYHPKEQVLGVEVAGVFKAYPFVELDKLAENQVFDELNGQDLVIYWDTKNRSASVKSLEDGVVQSMIAYWFAWYTFHPQTEIYTAP